jgi:hypothetical protein
MVDVGPIIIEGFTGINTRLPADRIRTLPGDDGRVDLSAAVNVVLDDSGKISRRVGFALSAAFAGAHSGFSDSGTCLCVKGGILYSFVPGVWTFTPLVGVGNDSTMRYCTGAGRIFFSNGVVIGEVKDGAASLFGTTTVAFKTTLPAGQAIAHHKARLYVGVDNMLWVSDVKPLSRADLRFGFKQFPHPIRMIASGPEGIYVGTEKAIFYGPGGNPLKMPFGKVSSCGAKDIPVQYRDASEISGLQIEGVFPVFTTDDGVCMGLPQGQILNLTEDKYAMPSGTTGASMAREIDGQTHFITAYR